MKEIPCLFRSFHNKVFSLKLGEIYQLKNCMGRKFVGKFIKVSCKGFNMLNVLTSRCIFERTIYQKDSATKKIGRRQAVFEINIPKCVTKIEMLSKKEIVDIALHPDCPEYYPIKEIPKGYKKCKTEEPVEDFLYRMEV